MVAPVGGRSDYDALFHEAGHTEHYAHVERSLAFEQVSLPAAAELVVIDSGIKHQHAGGEYRVRREECVESARRLGVRALRDATPEQLIAAALPPPLDARARHVVTENARVLAGRDALRRGDATTFGELMNESHRSMRDVEPDVNLWLRTIDGVEIEEEEAE